MAVTGGPHACLLGQHAQHYHAGTATPWHAGRAHMPFMVQRASTSCSPLLCAPAGWRGRSGCASGTPGAGRVAQGVLVCSRPPAVSGAGPQGAPPQAGSSGMAVGAKRVATGSQHAVLVSADCGGMRSGATYPTHPGFRLAWRIACMSLGSSSSRCVLSAFVHAWCVQQRGALTAEMLAYTNNSSQHGIPSAKSQTRWLMAAPCGCCRGQWLMPHATHGAWPGMFALP